MGINTCIGYIRYTMVGGIPILLIFVIALTSSVGAADPGYVVDSCPTSFLGVNKTYTFSSTVANAEKVKDKFTNFFSIKVQRGSIAAVYKYDVTSNPTLPNVTLEWNLVGGKFLYEHEDKTSLQCSVDIFSTTPGKLVITAQLDDSTEMNGVRLYAPTDCEKKAPREAGNFTKHSKNLEVVNVTIAVGETAATCYAPTSIGANYGTKVGVQCVNKGVYDKETIFEYGEHVCRFYANTTCTGEFLFNATKTNEGGCLKAGTLSGKQDKCGEGKQCLLKYTITGYPVKITGLERDGVKIQECASEAGKNDCYNVSSDINREFTVTMKGEQLKGKYTMAYTCNGEELTADVVDVVIKDKFAALIPFACICVEVIVLCVIIFFFERRHKQQVKEDEVPESKPLSEKTKA